MTRPPDAAIFVASLEIGGAERGAVQLAAALHHAGLSVDLVVVRAGGPLTSEVASGVLLTDLGARRTSTALLPLAAYLRRARPRVLVSYLTHASVVALVAARLARRRTPVVVMEVSVLSRIAAQSDRVRDRLLPAIARGLYPRAAAVVASGQGVAIDLAALSPRVAARVRVLAPPVVGARLWEGAAAPADHAWFEPGCPPVVVAVARLVLEKNLTTLLDAFASLLGRGRVVRLLMVGEGPERDSLEAHARSLHLTDDDVCLLGADPNPYRFVARAAVVALSSRVEGTPRALIEALALGVPVVSTDCLSGPREILAGGQYGRLVPVGDSSALADAIDATLTRPLAPAPREAWERYEVHRAAGDLHDLLRKLWREDATSRHSRS